MRFLDTFSGIGGFHLAAKRAIEGRCVGSIEIDPKARDTYANYFSDKLGEDFLALEDITKVDPAGLPDHDILFGGFPCQPFSRNGVHFTKNDRRVCSSDGRANLFLSLVNILEEKRPRFFVFENVKEIMSIRPEGDDTPFVDIVCEQIRNVGYDVRYEVMDTKDHGLPQQRKRVYFVGSTDSLDGFAFPAREELSTCVEDYLDKDVDDKYLLINAYKNRRNIRLRDLESVADRFKTNPYISYLRDMGLDGVETRMEALRLAYESGIWAGVNDSSMASEVVPVAIVYGDTPSGGPRQQDKIYSRRGCSPTIATFSTPPIDTDPWRLLTPRECARLQGFPDDMDLPGSDSVAYKQVGNAVSVNVAEKVLGSLSRFL